MQDVATGPILFMNTVTLTIATANKKIGFRLTGNLIIDPQSPTEAKISPDQTYQIEIFPDEAPLGMVANLRKRVVKSLPIELPKELRMISYEKAFVLLLQNDLRLTVSEQGYERMGNRKLFAEFSHPHYPSSVQVNLLIEGDEQDFDYRLMINPVDIKAAYGEVKEKNAMEYYAVPVSLGEMADLKEKIIKKVLLKLKPSNFQVCVSSKSISISLHPSLIQYISSLETPRLKAPRERNAFEEKQNQDPIDFEDVEITLVDIPEDNQEAYYLLDELERLFADKKNPGDAYLRKFSRIINQFYAAENFRVLNKSFSTLSEHSLANHDILSAISNALSRFQLINLQREMKAATGKKFRYTSTFIDTLEPAHYLKVMAIVIQSLRAIELKEKSVLLIYQQLKMLIGILNGLAIKKVKDDGTYIYKEVQELFVSFGNHPLMIDYLLRYCQQAFGSQKEVEFLSDNALNLFKDFAAIDDACSLEKPWTIPSKFFKSEKENQGTFSKIFFKFEFWRTNEQQWFTDLIAVRRMLLDPSPRMFLNFTNAIKANAADVQCQLDLRNPYFVFGLAETLLEISHHPEFEEMDEEIKGASKELLEMIFQNNEKEDKSLPFHIHQKAQRQELIEGLDGITKLLAPFAGLGFNQS